MSSQTSVRLKMFGGGGVYSEISLEMVVATKVPRLAADFWVRGSQTFMLLILHTVCLPSGGADTVRCHDKIELEATLLINLIVIDICEISKMPAPAARRMVATNSYVAKSEDELTLKEVRPRNAVRWFTCGA